MLDPIAAVLRGDPSGALALAPLDAAEVCVTARAHGVLPLLADALADSEMASMRRALDEADRPHACLDMTREQRLRELLAAFDSAGAPALLMKGAALAYTHYPRPDLRPRIDTDVLVRPADRSRAEAALREQGYRAVAQVSGDLVTSQAAFSREEDGVSVHTVDLHWQIANPRVFAGVLTFDDVAANAVPVAALGPSARALGDVHALLLACVHRVAHHAASDRLIWIYDVHLIASRLTDSGWRALAVLADARGVSLICRRSLERAAALFETPVPAHVWADPRLDPATHLNESSAGFLTTTKGQWRIFLSDVAALTRWRDRAHLVREHLFPPPDYMKRVYAPASRAPLGWLYAQRAWRGARRWMARS